ncbi:MAG: hypothetical protein N2234_09545 [Planctomycetota bacterium]|nr:hypothetical protein [Planctomycetota bacterium]
MLGRAWFLQVCDWRVGESCLRGHSDADRMLLAALSRIIAVFVPPPPKLSPIRHD